MSQNIYLDTVVLGFRVSVKVRIRVSVRVRVRVGVSFANTLRIQVSLLYFICLLIMFYCFVYWTPEASIFRLVRFMPRSRHKNKYNISKISKHIILQQNQKRKSRKHKFCSFIARVLVLLIYIWPFGRLQSAVKREYVVFELFCFC